MPALPRGYDRPLYVLPFDRRDSFETKLFGWTPPLDPEQTARIASAKRVIYDGFRSALAAGVPREKAGILVDEQFGAAILRDAAAAGIITACPAEKSGQKEFDFEYGEEFARHIEAFDPSFTKVLVRYNPAGDRALNRRHAARLKRLSDYLADRQRSRFMTGSGSRRACRASSASRSAGPISGSPWSPGAPAPRRASSRSARSRGAITSSSICSEAAIRPRWETEP